MKYENFNDAEALKIAMNIEEEGLECYSLLMKSAKDDKAKDIFSELALAEKKHLALFQKTYSEITTQVNPGESCEDYTVDLYLKDLVYTGIFSKKGEARRLATEIKSDIEALKIGIQAEKDSILYYRISERWSVGSVCTTCARSRGARSVRRCTAGDRRRPGGLVEEAVSRWQR